MIFEVKMGVLEGGVSKNTKTINSDVNALYEKERCHQQQQQLYLSRIFFIN